MTAAHRSLHAHRSLSPQVLEAMARPPTVRVEEVIVVEWRRGEGCCEADPTRFVTTVYGKDGRLIAERDSLPGRPDEAVRDPEIAALLAAPGCRCGHSKAAHVERAVRAECTAVCDCKVYRPDGVDYDESAFWKDESVEPIGRVIVAALERAGERPAVVDYKAEALYILDAVSAAGWEWRPKGVS